MERKYKIALIVVVLSAALLSVLDFTNQNREARIDTTFRANKQRTTPTTLPPVEKPTTTPEVTPVTPLTISPPPISTEEELPATFLRMLPYSGDGYYVEYFSTTKRLAVTIQSGSFSQKQTEVYGWLEKQGVKGAHSLDIIWSSNRRFVGD